MRTRRRGVRTQARNSANNNHMITYGDMVTLILVFFVMLFAMSTVDARKWEEMVNSIASARALERNLSTPRPIQTVAPSPLQDAPLVIDDIVDPLDDGLDSALPPGAIMLTAADLLFMELATNIGVALSNSELAPDVLTDSINLRIVLQFPDNVFFDSGSAAIKTEAITTLDALKLIIADNQEYFDTVRIEGNTDNVPISSTLYPTNWELSSARANSVLRYLYENPPHILDPTKLSSAGYGEFRPIDTNETPEGRARNRRVDIVIEGIRDLAKIEELNVLLPD